MKLDPKLEYWEQKWGWVGHPAGADTPAKEELTKHRYALEILGGVEKDPDYDYDEYAIIRWKRKYYLLETSGCSCPSPSETWSIIIGPATKQALKEKIEELVKEAGSWNGWLTQERGNLLKAVGHGK